MFHIDPQPTFTAPVKLSAPGQPAETIQITWWHKGRKAMKDWLDAFSDGSLTDADGLAEVIAGWDGIVDSFGQPVPFSREALAKLLDAYQTAGAELVRAYVGALTESRLGN